jgi:gamma-D-glutamyl-L-lysine dipeptidyl-peptidase
MNKAYTDLSIIPLRAEPTEKAEMVNQMVYGESCTILEIEGLWAKIKTDEDGYVAWVSKNQLIKNQPSLVGPNKIRKPFQIHNFKLFPMGCMVSFETQDVVGDVGDLAKTFLDVPYLWGGKTFVGMDCSGFIQGIHASFDVKLPRDAYQQAEVGDAILFHDYAALDLAFFKNEKGSITHVGLLLEDSEIIHASGQVRIDEFRRTGIFKNGELTHELSHINRIANKMQF